MLKRVLFILVLVAFITAGATPKAEANTASDIVTAPVEFVIDVVVEVWDTGSDLTAAAGDWVKEHPWETATIVLVLGPPAWELVAIVKGGPIAYEAMSTTAVPYVEREVTKIFIKKAPKNVCFVSRRACGEWVAKATRDPKRLVSDLSKAERDQVFKAAKCTETTCVSAISGLRIPRSIAQVDHIIPWSCGGATVLSNLRVVSADENRARPSCTNVVSGRSTSRRLLT